MHAQSYSPILKQSDNVGAPLLLALTFVKRSVLFVKGTLEMYSVACYQDVTRKARAFLPVPLDLVLPDITAVQEGSLSEGRVMQQQNMTLFLHSVLQHESIQTSSTI